MEANDLSNKITDLFYSNTFSSNSVITKRICFAWKIFRDIKYIIPKSERKGTWYGIQKKLLGKRVGESFFLSGDAYTIKDISW